jgi:hypothetical protein
VCACEGSYVCSKCEGTPHGRDWWIVRWDDGDEERYWAADLLRRDPCDGNHIYGSGGRVCLRCGAKR